MKSRQLDWPQFLPLFSSWTVLCSAQTFFDISFWKGNCFGFCKYFIQHYFICCLSNSTVSDLELNLGPLKTFALAVRRSKHSARCIWPQVFCERSRVRKFYGWIQNDRWATQIRGCELTVPRRGSKTVAPSLLFSRVRSKELSSIRFRLEKWDKNPELSVSWTDI